MSARNTETIKKVYRLAVKGETRVVIAAEVGLTLNQVNGIVNTLRKHGVKIPLYNHYGGTVASVAREILAEERQGRSVPISRVNPSRI